MALTVSYIPRRTKLYYMDDDLTFIEYIYIGIRGKKFVVETISGAEIEMNASHFGRLSLSKIVILSEIEEQLRNKIEYIHSLMRQHKVKYNPLDTADVIYVNNPFGNKYTGKEVHQYNKKTGMFIRTYPSVTSANKVLGKEPRSNTISKAANGNRKSAYGYRWSHTKFKILK